MASSEHLWQLRQRRTLPIAEWVTRYRKQWLQPDILSGLTTAAVVIPKAMAYICFASFIKRDNG